MKKLFVLALALTMVLALAVTAIAAAVPVKDDVPAEKTVDVTITPAGTVTNTLGATITWDDVAVAYTNGGTIWNTSTHEYDTVLEGSWSDAEASVTVQNDSDVSIWVTVSATNANNGTAIVTLGDNAAESELVKWNNTDNTDAKTVTITASGVPASNGAIATITVTLADAAA